MSEKRPISDDDLCSECFSLEYEPGANSACMMDWPCTLINNDGYIIDCPKYKECEPGDNWIMEEING